MTTATKKTSKTDELAKLRKAISGINKHLLAVATLLLAGQSITPAALVQLFQAYVDLAAAIDTARAKVQALLAQEKLMGVNVHLLLQALHAFIVAQYGNQAAEMLADFGFAPKKATQLTAEQKAAAAAKRTATRKARHTMGSKQKKDIHGAPAPAPAPAATPAPEPAPAAAK
jgi:hypothetical protein